MAVSVATCVGHSIVTGTLPVFDSNPYHSYPTNDVRLLSPTGLGSWGDSCQGDENNLERSGLSYTRTTIETVGERFGEIHPPWQLL